MTSNADRLPLETEPVTSFIPHRPAVHGCCVFLLQIWKLQFNFNIYFCCLQNYFVMTRIIQSFVYLNHLKVVFVLCCFLLSLHVIQNILGSKFVISFTSKAPTFFVVQHRQESYSQLLSIQYNFKRRVWIYSQRFKRKQNSARAHRTKFKITSCAKGLMWLSTFSLKIGLYLSLFSFWFYTCNFQFWLKLYFLTTYDIKQSQFVFI